LPTISPIKRSRMKNLLRCKQTLGFRLGRTDH
jgi:hypothetical protein